MQLKNTSTSFGLVAIFPLDYGRFNYWAIGSGFIHGQDPISLEKLKLYGWHKEYGFLVLFLAFSD